jgi:phytoene synthase
MTPDQYCQDKAARSGSSFYYSFLFLPPVQRRAITALYAFCREVDDIVDMQGEPGIARIKLNWWREEIARLFTGQAQHPVTSVVGLLAAEIFGYRDRHTLKYAHDLGIAFQLTNIVRDVYEDAQRNRIYLPLDELLRFGVQETDILNKKETPAFHALMRFQAERAKQYYTQALSQLPDADRYSQRCGLIMAAIYRATLEEMERDGFHVLQHRISLTPLRKLWLAWKTGLQTRRYKHLAISGQ